MHRFSEYSDEVLKPASLDEMFRANCELPEPLPVVRLLRMSRHERLSLAMQRFASSRVTALVAACLWAAVSMIPISRYLDNVRAQSEKVVSTVAASSSYDGGCLGEPGCPGNAYHGLAADGYPRDYHITATY